MWLLFWRYREWRQRTELYNEAFGTFRGQEEREPVKLMRRNGQEFIRKTKDMKVNSRNFQEGGWVSLPTDLLKD